MSHDLRSAMTEAKLAVATVFKPSQARREAQAMWDEWWGTEAAMDLKARVLKRLGYELGDEYGDAVDEAVNGAIADLLLEALGGTK